VSDWIPSIFLGPRGGAMLVEASPAGPGRVAVRVPDVDDLTLEVDAGDVYPLGQV
jgi:hypothetical protein